MTLTWLACERAAHSRLGLRFFDSSLFDDFLSIQIIEFYQTWVWSMPTLLLIHSLMFLRLDCYDPYEERGYPTQQSCWRLFCWKWFLRDLWRLCDCWASVWWSLGYRSSWFYAWHLAWRWLKNGLATVWRLTTVWQKRTVSLERAGWVTITMWFLFWLF